MVLKVRLPSGHTSRGACSRGCYVLRAEEATSGHGPVVGFGFGAEDGEMDSFVLFGRCRLDDKIRPEGGGR